MSKAPSWCETPALQKIAAGRAEAGHVYVSDDNIDGDFDDVATADAAEALAAFAAEVTASDRVAADLALDHEFTLRGRTLSLRWVYHTRCRSRAHCRVNLR